MAAKMLAAMRTALAAAVAAAALLGATAVRARAGRGAAARRLHGAADRRRARRARGRARPIPGADPDAVELGQDVDGDGDADVIQIHLEVIEIQEQVYPGEYVTFWVFAPLGSANGAPARLPSPTIRVEEGDVVYVTLHNTHYLPHTIHFHGTGAGERHGRRAGHDASTRCRRAAPSPIGSSPRTPAPTGITATCRTRSIR